MNGPIFSNLNSKADACAIATWECVNDNGDYYWYSQGEINECFPFPYAWAGGTSGSESSLGQTASFCGPCDASNSSPWPGNGTGAICRDYAYPV